MPKLYLLMTGIFLKGKKQNILNTNAEIRQNIEITEKKREDIIEKKKPVDKKIPPGNPDEKQKFDTSLDARKFFMDTIKIIACRAETTLVNIVKKQMSSPEQARAPVRRLYSAAADIQAEFRQIKLITS
jgi:hypothetical protein